MAIIKKYNSETEFWEIETLGKQGPEGASGSVSVVSPLVNSGTSESPEIDINYNNLQYGKNLIINGAFDIWQRGTSFTHNANVYTADNWRLSADTAFPTLRTITQRSFNSGDYSGGSVPDPVPKEFKGATFYLRSTLTTVGSSTKLRLQNIIEDVRTLAGQTATFSFWARSDSLRLQSVQFAQIFGLGGSPSVFGPEISFTTTPTWTRFVFSFSIPSISGLTVGSNSSFRVGIHQELTDGNVLDIWGVQLEAGSEATEFKRNSPSLALELAACQRYYFRIAGNSGAYAFHGTGRAMSSTTYEVLIEAPVPMRIAPTSVDFSNLAITDTFNVGGGVSTLAISSTQSSSSIMCVSGSGSNFTSGRQLFLINNNNTAGFIGFSAEL